jgi:hypothetical protein
MMNVKLVKNIQKTVSNVDMKMLVQPQLAHVMMDITNIQLKKHAKFVLTNVADVPITVKPKKPLQDLTVLNVVLTESTSHPVFVH